MVPFRLEAESDPMLTGQFNWTVGAPVVSPANRPSDPCHAIKDPSVVYYRGRWHLFCTIRSQKKTHQLEYLSFVDFKNASKAERHVLQLSGEYVAAPQVFYFSRHRRWYLIYQVVDKTRKPALQPAYSTTDDISDPRSWTQPILLFSSQPANITMWIDFWVICDGNRAHLFFTSLDGKMWKAETTFSDFPAGWNRPKVVLQADIFEASHTYRLDDHKKFLTIVEAQRKPNSLSEKLRSRLTGKSGSWRYYKAYLSERLDGPWLPLAATPLKPFAGIVNVRGNGSTWTSSFSHGELIRNGFDETLSVETSRLRFLFQGVNDEDLAGKQYGEIPWRIGILETTP
jgi:hypothetical protein